MSELPPRNPLKRKRKRTLATNLRKCAKKTNAARGFQLDSDNYQYFSEILRSFKKDTLPKEEQDLLARNVFQQVENNEINFSSNQIASCVIESLLPYSSDDVLNQFVDKFTPELRKICSDSFASHVLETIIKISCNRIIDQEIKPNIRNKHKENVLKISRFLFNNLQDYVWDCYANPIIRTILKSFSFKEQTNDIKIEIPDEFIETIKDYSKQLISWPQFKDLPYTDLTSGLIQIILECLTKIDLKLFKIYVQKLIDESFTESEGLLDVYEHKSAIIVLEMCLKLSPVHYVQLYEKCFKGRMNQLLDAENCHFTLQKLIENCPDVQQFEEIFTEIIEYYAVFLRKGHLNVIVAIAQGCQRFSTKQKEFLEITLKEFNCSEPTENQQFIVPSLCTREFSNDLKKQLNYHGIIIVETLLGFTKPKLIVKSLLNMNVDDLKKLFTDRIGSHVADAFSNSQFVKTKNKIELISKLKGEYQTLAGSKGGSRALEALWRIANEQMKIDIMEELGNKSQSWCNTISGRVIANKFHLTLFLSNKRKWISDFANKSGHAPLEISK